MVQSLCLHCTDEVLDREEVVKFQSTAGDIQVR